MVGTWVIPSSLAARTRAWPEMIVFPGPSSTGAVKPNCWILFASWRIWRLECVRALFEKLTKLVTGMSTTCNRGDISLFIESPREGQDVTPVAHPRHSSCLNCRGRRKRFTFGGCSNAELETNAYQLPTVEADGRAQKRAPRSEEH